MPGGHRQPLGSSPVGWLQAAGGFVRLQGIPADTRLGTNVLINCSVLQKTASIRRCEICVGAIEQSEGSADQPRRQGPSVSLLYLQSNLLHRLVPSPLLLLTPACTAFSSDLCFLIKQHPWGATPLSSRVFPALLPTSEI